MKPCRVTHWVQLFPIAEMNGTTTNSSSSATPKPPACKSSPPGEATNIGLCTAYIAVMLVALFGNSLIIHTVRTKRRLRKVPFNILIVSMASADILDALIAPPISIWFALRGKVWFGGIAGAVSCKLMQFLLFVSLCASVFTLTAIALDRYTAIVHVMKKPFTKKTVKLAAFASWLLAVLLSASWLYRFRLDHDPDTGVVRCIAQWSEDRAKNRQIGVYESTTRLVLLYVIPLSLLGVLYSAIVHVLRKRRGLAESVSEKRIQRQNRAVIRMLVTLVLLFAFCWLPIQVVSSLASFDREVLRCAPRPVTLFSYWLGHANSAINPCIYMIFNENFRKCLMDFLCCWKKFYHRRGQGALTKPASYQNPVCDADRPEAKSRGVYTLTDGTVETRL